jgi:hypothetical protein
LCLAIAALTPSRGRRCKGDSPSSAAITQSDVARASTWTAPKRATTNLPLRHWRLLSRTSAHTPATRSLCTKACPRHREESTSVCEQRAKRAAEQARIIVHRGCHRRRAPVTYAVLCMRCTLTVAPQHGRFSALYAWTPSVNPRDEHALPDVSAYVPTHADAQSDGPLG